MRIAIIVPFYPFPPSVGGVKTIAIEVARELTRLGHEVVIITSPIDNVTKSIVTEKCIEVRDGVIVANLLPGFIRIGDIRGLTGPRTLRYLDRILHTIDADVIHVHNIHPYIYQVLKYIRKKLSINVKRPVVVVEPHHPAVSLHNPLLRQVVLPISVQWMKTKIRFIDKIVAHTIMELKWWLSKGIDKVSLVRFPAVRDELFTYQPSKTELCDMNTLTFVGRIVPVKRIEFLLYVIAALKRKIPDIKLFIIGPADKRYKKKLDHLVKMLKLERNVKFTGPMYGSTKYDYIACSKVVVLASEKEYTPNVIIEAQALGVPVVATNVGAIKELVLNGKTGFLIEPDDIYGFANAILKLLTHSELWNSMSKNARKYARFFSLQANVRKLLKIYTREV